MRVTLTNDYHGTEVRINVPKDGVLTKRQTKRAKSALCGVTDCTCGRIRGLQHGGSLEVTTVWSEDDQCELYQITEQSNSY